MSDSDWKKYRDELAEEIGEQTDIAVAELKNHGYEEMVWENDKLQSSISTALTSPDKNKIAWITNETYYILRIISNGKLILEMEMDSYTYNGYFGFGVDFMKWYGDTLIIIYWEKHLNILASVSINGEIELLYLNRNWMVDQNTVYHQKYQEEEILLAVKLPDLVQLGPVPVKDRKKFNTDCYENNSEGFTKKILAAFTEHGFDHKLISFLIGSWFYKFFTNSSPARKTYKETYGDHCWRWNSPQCLPFFWYQYLPSNEKRLFTDNLKKITETIFSDENDPAIEYIKIMAGRVYTACIEGVIQENLRWHFWKEDWFLKKIQAERNKFPTGFNEIVDILMPHSEKWKKLEAEL